MYGPSRMLTCSCWWSRLIFWSLQISSARPPSWPVWGSSGCFIHSPCFIGLGCSLPGLGKCSTLISWACRIVVVIFITPRGHSRCAWTAASRECWPRRRWCLSSLSFCNSALRTATEWHRIGWPCVLVSSWILPISPSVFFNWGLQCPWGWYL